ncbi:MAG: chaperonin GroEL [Anaerolineae bacterium]|nr:chaperonin GroEL [Anaerolineae bacterium]
MTQPLKKWQNPGVVFQPRASRGFQRGINQLVKAISPTLGPLPRLVVNESQAKKNELELLDNGAVIARRILMLPQRSEDVGAMYLRQMLWQVHETTGDGTATAAVLFQSIYNQGLHYIAAGGNAMSLRRHLEQAAQLICAELNRLTLQLQGQAQLAGLAETLCGDPPLAKMLGEIFDMIGAEGRLEIRPGRRQELEREYVEGSYWSGGLFSRAMAGHPSGKVSLENGLILLTDLEIREAQEVVPLLAMALRAGIKSLLLVAAGISEQALAVLLTPANRERVRVIAVKAPAMTSPTRHQELEDLAILTGGRLLLAQAGDTLAAVQPEDLGRARRVWADKDYLGMVGGKGDSRQLRRRIAELRTALAQAQEANERKRLQERLGKLTGGVAVLWVGGLSPVAVEARTELAKQTAEAMRGALREGVVPGGGVSLLKCKPVLQEKVRRAQCADERVAYTILLKAVEAPLRTLLSNAGYSAEEALAQIGQDGSGAGFDVVRGQVVNLERAGIVDAASTVKTAVLKAIHGAALALTIDVLVHRADAPVEPNL